jgi:HSP20 family molecular chaperone IbpA
VGIIYGLGQSRRHLKEVAMDDSFRRAAAMRGPMNDANPNSGRFGLLPSLLEEFFQPSHSQARGASFPLDIEETESAYQLTVDLPELEKKRHQHRLARKHANHIRRTQRGAPNRGRILWHERAAGRVSRTIQLPQVVDADAVQAN